jgi:hypothetical protein
MLSPLSSQFGGGGGPGGAAVNPIRNGQNYLPIEASCRMITQYFLTIKV